MVENPAERPLYCYDVDIRETRSGLMYEGTITSPDDPEFADASRPLRLEFELAVRHIDQRLQQRIDAYLHHQGRVHRLEEILSNRTILTLKERGQSASGYVGIAREPILQAYALLMNKGLVRAAGRDALRVYVSRGA